MSSGDSDPRDTKKHITHKASKLTDSIFNKGDFLCALCLGMAAMKLCCM